MRVIQLMSIKATIQFSKVSKGSIFNDSITTKQVLGEGAISSISDVRRDDPTDPHSISMYSRVHYSADPTTVFFNSDGRRRDSLFTLATYSGSRPNGDTVGNNHWPSDGTRTNIQYKRRLLTNDGNLRGVQYGTGTGTDDGEHRHIIAP